MPKPEDVKPLPNGDFRANRVYLADHVFAVRKRGRKRKRDLVPQEVWDHMMTLPTDVLLRSTDYHGSMLDDLATQHQTWLDSIPLEPTEIPFLFDAALDAADEFGAAPFIAAHGYYRQATGCLRNALEAMTHATRFAVRNDLNEFQLWRAGTSEPLKFGRSVDLLAQAPKLADADRQIGSPGMFGNKPPGVLRTLYTNLCRYAHGQPGYSNFDSWQSNGPIHSPKAFTQFWCDFCDTFAACCVLLKIGYPSFALPSGTYSIYAAASKSWLGLANDTCFFFFGHKP